MSAIQVPVAVTGCEQGEGDRVPLCHAVWTSSGASVTTFEGGKGRNQADRFVRYLRCVLHDDAYLYVVQEKTGPTNSPQHGRERSV